MTTDLSQLPRETDAPDAAAAQTSFVERYGRLRKTLDESLAHLVEPAERATRQIAYLDRELAGLDDNSPVPLDLGAFPADI